MKLSPTQKWALGVLGALSVCTQHRAEMTVTPQTFGGLVRLRLVETYPDAQGYRHARLTDKGIAQLYAITPKAVLL